MNQTGFLWHAVLTDCELKVEKSLKDTGRPLGTWQSVNAARDAVRGGNGRAGAAGKQIEGHEEQLAWTEARMKATHGEEWCHQQSMTGYPHISPDTRQGPEGSQAFQQQKQVPELLSVSLRGEQKGTGGGLDPCVGAPMAHCLSGILISWEGS